VYNRFPDVTREQFGDDDRTCIICREDMELGKKYVRAVLGVEGWYFLRDVWSNV